METVSIIIPAGIGNLISGRAYHGLKELANTNWVVDTILYFRCQTDGNWYDFETSFCQCGENCETADFGI